MAALEYQQMIYEIMSMDEPMKETGPRERRPRRELGEHLTHCTGLDEDS